MTEGEREGDGEDEGSRNETQTDCEIQEQGAEGKCQNLGDCLCQHSGASGFEDRLSWRAEVTDAHHAGKCSSHNNAALSAKNQYVEKWGKDEENESERGGDIYMLTI